MTRFSLHRQPDDCMSHFGCRFSVFSRDKIVMQFDPCPTGNQKEDNKQAQEFVDLLNAGWKALKGE